MKRSSSNLLLWLTAPFESTRISSREENTPFPVCFPVLRRGGAGHCNVTALLPNQLARLQAADGGGWGPAGHAKWAERGTPRYLQGPGTKTGSGTQLSRNFCMSLPRAF